LIVFVDQLLRLRISLSLRSLFLSLDNFPLLLFDYLIDLLINSRLIVLDVKLGDNCEV
jgi:hypothetical protein